MENITVIGVLLLSADRALEEKCIQVVRLQDLDRCVGSEEVVLEFVRPVGGSHPQVIPFELVDKRDFVPIRIDPPCVGAAVPHRMIEVAISKVRPTPPLALEVPRCVPVVADPVVPGHVESTVEASTAADLSGLEIQGAPCRGDPPALLAVLFDLRHQYSIWVGVVGATPNLGLRVACKRGNAERWDSAQEMDESNFLVLHGFFVSTKRLRGRRRLRAGPCTTTR